MSPPFKTIEPLDEAPEFARGFLLGYCEVCERPITRNGPLMTRPELRRWFVRGHDSETGNHICQTCHRRSKRPAPPVREPDQAPGTPRKLPEAEIVRLRLLVGACVVCGWAEDDDARVHRCVVPSEDNDEEADHG